MATKSNEPARNRTLGTMDGKIPPPAQAAAYVPPHGKAAPAKAKGTPKK